MTDPYASHLPILKFVLALVKPEFVLELGAGKYSTAEFLKCDSLAKLFSLETDPEWADAVLDEIGDYRLTLETVDDIPAALDGAPEGWQIQDFDLIFVDNGQNAEERIAAIRAVLSRPHPITVIHDAEIYGGVIHELAENRITFNFDTPWTAVCW